MIVQFEPRHEEVIPSVIAACNGAGFRPTVLLNRRSRRLRGDIFAQVTGGEADIQYQSLSTDFHDGEADWSALLKDVEFVVLNTLNRTKVAEWARKCGKPVIALVHNVDQFLKDRTISGLLDNDHFAFLTLAPHVTAEMNARTDAGYIDKFGLLTYCVLSDKISTYDVASPRKVVVPGNLSLRTRDYIGLIDVLSAYRDRWQNLVFEFPSSGADRDAVANAISQNNLEEKAHILPLHGKTEIPHSEVFASFRSATVFHPLIAADFVQYRRTKITSTASMSVGFGVPMIMDRYSQACYRFPMLVSDCTIEASLDRLSEVEDEELMALHSSLNRYRRDMVAYSASEMARLIERIC